MRYAIKRLSLGVCLIALASAILLFADRGHRAASAHAAMRVAVLQHASTQVLDDGVRGVLDGLAARGYRDGDRIVVQRFNAHGDMPTGIAIARQVTAGDYDLVITSSTPSLQAVANNNRNGKVRHLSPSSPIRSWRASASIGRTRSSTRRTWRDRARFRRSKRRSKSPAGCCPASSASASPGIPPRRIRSRS